MHVKPLHFDHTVETKRRAALYLLWELCLKELATYRESTGLETTMNCVHSPFPLGSQCQAGVVHEAEQ